MRFMIYGWRGHSWRWERILFACILTHHSLNHKKALNHPLIFKLLHLLNHLSKPLPPLSFNFNNLPHLKTLMLVSNIMTSPIPRTHSSNGMYTHWLCCGETLQASSPPRLTNPKPLPNPLGSIPRVFICI
jgi:hypothetical protein